MKTILVVDNHPLILQFMHGLLEEKGHEVFAVEDGLAALNLLKTIQPDVIFTDLIMPNIRGDKLCRIIRNIPQLKGVPIYVLSALISEGDIHSGQWGVDGCIPKGPLHIMARQVLAAIGSVNDRVILPAFAEKAEDRFMQHAVVRELIESHGHMDNILNHMSEGLLELTADNQVIYANLGATAFFNLSEDQILGRPFTQLFPDTEHGRVLDLLQQTGKTDASTSRRHFALNGRLLIMRMFPLDNAPLRTRLVIINDETDQIKAEEALYASKKKYQRLVEGLQQIIFDVTSDGILTYINPAVESITGYAASEILGTRICDYVVEDDRLRIHEALNDIRTGVERDFELQVVSSREEMRWLQVSCSPLFVHDQWIGVQGMASDVTEKKQLQRHLIHSHRLAATGQLAGCIAHEINSPLQGITALLNLIKTEHTDHPETLHCIKLLEQAYASIRNTVQKMVSLSQPHKTEKHPLNINDMIHDALKICHTRLKHKKISLYLNLRRKVPLIQACPQELKQVFLCLIQNSLEAFNRGSMTKVETSLPDQTEQDSHQKNFISIDTYVIDNYIIIDYSDSGPGISSEDLEHVFDPFYTCKKTLGMGIGLSVCYQIIEDHRGYMKIMNMNDQQTVFRIKLPVYNLPGTREGDGYEINEKDG